MPARLSLPPLDAVRVLECATFVAGPSAGMTLAQLGADVIRVDQPGGAADYGRWPVSRRTGRSLYWTSLNRGKRSVAIDMRSPEGRELVLALSTADGRDGGVVIDNNVGRPWLSYAALTARRVDVIQVHIQGYRDGRPAVDYTVNAEVGVPGITGPTDVSEPVNHVLPAWDLLTGAHAVTGVLSALRHRDRTGEGTYVELALADVALAGVAGMGWLSEAVEAGADRPRHGNHLFGSFGVDFATADGQRVMVVALTARQWDALRRVTHTEEVFAALEQALGVNLSIDTDRYQLRETIAAVLRPWFLARTLDVASHELEAAQVLWSRYRSMNDVVADELRPNETSVLTHLEQPGVGTVVSASSPLRVDSEYGDVRPAPHLGEHTEEVLTEVLGLDSVTLGALYDRGLVSGPESAT